MFDRFHKTARTVFENARDDGRLTRNPTSQELRTFALQEPQVRETAYGNIIADSEPTSRAAMLTKNNIDSEFGREEVDLLEQAEKCLKHEELVSIDVSVGDGTAGTTARLIVPKRFAHVAYGGLKLFKPTVTEDPTHQVIMFFDDEYEKNMARPLPEKSITIRLAFSPDGKLVKLVRNSNYFGEWKKGVFAGEDWRAKQSGDGLFIHAGCRQDYLELTHGDYGLQNSMFVALSANGKTSTSCKILARKDQEKSWLIQDDGGILQRDGSFRGFEPGALFVKTDGLNPREQQEAYYGCLKADTFLENVYTDEAGEVDFYEIERTSNGRAVIERRDFTHAGKDINVDQVHNIFLITRGNIIPALSALTHEQATALMVLGQSMESSAGDPTQAGKIKNEFFYDPFVAGSRTDHANLFYDLLCANPQINCYLLNTGSIGEGMEYHDITLNDTMGILDSVLRGGLEDWVVSPATGLKVPKTIRMVDTFYLHPERLFTHASFEQKQKDLDHQRAEILEQYPGLHPKVRSVYAG